MSTRAVEQLVAGGPRWQRPALRLLLTMGARPRGRVLLRRVPGAEQAATGLLSMVIYDDPAIARSLGWDADAVAARGRALRALEGRDPRA